MDVLTIDALLFEVYIRAPDFLETPVSFPNEDIGTHTEPG